MSSSSSPVPDAEVDSGHAEVLQAGEDLAGGGQDVAPVVGGAEHAGPRVEQLDGVGPGLDLGPQRRQHDAGQRVEQRRPELGLGVHERLGGGVVLGRADQVGGQGERPAGEADEGDVELAAEDADRLQHVGDVGLGLQRAQPVEVGGGAERLGDDRPGRQVDVDADADQRRDDVGEEDGGVDAEPAHRLHGDLGGQVGRGDDLEHAVALADRPVLGQRPSRLAHEPHRHLGHRLAPAGVEEGRGHRHPTIPATDRHGRTGSTQQGLAPLCGTSSVGTAPPQRTGDTERRMQPCPGGAAAECHRFGGV